MKKLTVIILAIALIFSIGTTLVFAASATDYTNAPPRKADTSSRSFVDDNNDGVCDTRNEGCQFVDDNNDGVCDTRNEGCQFVDNNDDGVCDTYPKGDSRNRNGAGRKNGRGRGNRCNGA